ncbi:MAG: hypothetical protein KatS3mg024_2146 [Armatimonadota bacterium]|nr:MAG: hypothetical protein KatS3mg024_2146 [Armatimonadota bacterium]
MERTKTTTPNRNRDQEAPGHHQTALVIVDCQALVRMHDLMHHDHLHELHDHATPVDELGMAA